MPVIHDHLDAEDLACLGMRRADSPFSDFFAEIRREGQAQLLHALATDCFRAAQYVPSEAEAGEEYLAAAAAVLAPDSTGTCRQRKAHNAPPDGLRPAAEAASKLPRRQRKPTLASVARQASKAEIEVTRYEIKPDGTIVVVTGKIEPTEASNNPWLADLKVTKQ
jgi:hypothetical protein